jgi:hypothetical protein
VTGKTADIGAYEVDGPPIHVTVQVNDGAVQRSRVTSLKVSFDQTVTLPVNPVDAFVLVRHSDKAAVTLNTLVVGNDVTLTFTGGPVENGSLADGRYSLAVLAAQVPNLDGNGDGSTGDNFVLAGTPANGLFRLFGDGNGDGTVNGADFLAFRLAFLSNYSTFDYDADGLVTGSDFLQFRLRFLNTI